MSKYSILFEAERFHKIGPFRFPVFEDLTPGEAKGIEALTKKQAKSTYRSMRLAQRISKDKEISIKDALNALSEIGDEKNEAILYEYSADIEALSADSISAMEQKIEYVSLFMKHRGLVKLPSSSGWSQTDDWAESDTEVLPTKILEQIFQFILWERDGWPKEAPEEESAGNAVVETPSPKPKS